MSLEKQDTQPIHNAGSSYAELEWAFRKLLVEAKKNGIDRRFERFTRMSSGAISVLPLRSGTSVEALRERVTKGTDFLAGHVLAEINQGGEGSQEQVEGLEKFIRFHPYMSREMKARFRLEQGKKMERVDAAKAVAYFQEVGVLLPNDGDLPENEEEAALRAEAEMYLPGVMPSRISFTSSQVSYSCSSACTPVQPTQQPHDVPPGWGRGSYPPAYQSHMLLNRLRATFKSRRKEAVPPFPSFEDGQDSSGEDTNWEILSSPQEERDTGHIIPEPANHSGIPALLPRSLNSSKEGLHMAMDVRRTPRRVPVMAGEFRFSQAGEDEEDVRLIREKEVPAAAGVNGPVVLVEGVSNEFVLQYEKEFSEFLEKHETAFEAFLGNKLKIIECPILREVMKFPVIASDHNVYNRASIQQVFDAGGENFPKSGLPITDKTLHPVCELRELISCFRNEFLEKLKEQEEQKASRKKAKSEALPLEQQVPHVERVLRRSSSAQSFLG